MILWNLIKHITHSQLKFYCLKTFRLNYFKKYFINVDPLLWIEFLNKNKINKSFSNYLLNVTFTTKSFSDLYERLKKEKIYILMKASEDLIKIILDNLY